MGGQRGGKNASYNTSSKNTVSMGISSRATSSSGAAGDYDNALAGPFGLGRYSGNAVLLFVRRCKWLPESATHPASGWLHPLV